MIHLVEVGCTDLWGGDRLEDGYCVLQGVCESIESKIDEVVVVHGTWWYIVVSMHEQKLTIFEM